MGLSTRDEFAVDENGLTFDGYRRLAPVSKKAMYIANVIAIVVVAATNRPDSLDPALLRPGRFDRQVVVELPDVQERLDILRIHVKKVKVEESVDLERVARATPGSSGADLANLVNEAALFAARANRTVVSMEDFEKARDKILLGVARESVYMTAEEKRATAYHEAGHTLLHYYLKNADPLHKVTIIPHGRALGLTMSLPEKDAYTKNRSFLEDRIKICMGGYVAEDIVYGETTTGTSNDIKQATQMARRMVTVVPFPGVERTRRVSIKLSMMVNPMPARSSPPVVNIGALARSTSAMPTPQSFTTISREWSSRMRRRMDTLPRVSG